MGFIPNGQLRAWVLVGCIFALVQPMAKATTQAIDCEAWLTQGQSSKNPYRDLELKSVLLSEAEKGEFRALIQSAGSETFESQLAAWVTNDQRLQHLVLFLPKLTSSQHQAASAVIRARAKSMNDVILVKRTGLPLQYAFEKETKNEAVLDLFTINYWDGFVPETPELRYSLLWGHEGYSLTPKSAEYSFLSDRLDFEGFGVYEIKHRGFEVSIDRALYQMFEISRVLKEKSGFHLHIVFDHPDGTESVEGFGAWWMYLNLSLQMSGLSQGSHLGGNIREAIIRSNQSQFSYSDFDSLWTTPTKFHSAGLRARIYGDSALSNGIKVGIELRDISPSLSEWERVARKVSRSISEEIWSQSPEFSLEVRKWISQNFIEAIAGTYDAGARTLQLRMALGNSTATEFLRAENEIRYVLLPWETLSYPDFATQTWVKPTPAQVERIVKAREKFIESMVALKREVDRIPPGDPEGLRGMIPTAIRMDLPQWARDSGINELLGRY